MAQTGTTQLQYYRHDYAKVCMTGLLGCRWHRYKQSTKGSSKRDVACFVFCLLVSLYVIFWFYYWLIAANDKFSVNETMYTETQSRFDWFLLALVIFIVLFSYVILLLLLSLCHIIQGHQLFTHPVHLALMLIILLACIAVTIAMEEMWEEEWSVIALSLQVFCNFCQNSEEMLCDVKQLGTCPDAELPGSKLFAKDIMMALSRLKVFGPFLQLGAVGFMTLLSWVIASKWFKLIKLETKLGSICGYCVLMLALYISPLFINSPCVILEENLPPKPKMFAHRGASSLAPENTVIAFDLAAQYGAYGVETDVQISLDGELIIMHDTTLHRTTNVADVYPDLIDQHSAYFNFSQLENLSAGDWFLKADPTGSVKSLSEEQKSVYRNQKIPTFLRTLELCVRHNMAVMFDIYMPPTSHPYYNDTYPSIVDIVSMSAINKSKVFYPTSNLKDFKPPSGWTRLYSDIGASVGYLQQNNYSGVHVEHMNTDTDLWRLYKKNNLTTSVYQVNKAWLYSFYWCTGTGYITTDYCDVISKVEKPIYHLSPRSYLVLWVVADCTSVVLIIIMFSVQRYRLYSHRYHPERMSLSSHSNGSSTWGPKRTRRSMKEKLLMRDVQADTYDFEPDDDLGIDSNGYNATVTESEGRELSQAFKRHSYHSNTAKDTEENETDRAFDSNRASYHSNSNGFPGNGNEVKRASFISSVENGDLFGDASKRNSYQATDNLNGAGHTDIFPNGTADLNLNSSTNTYQSETAFT